MPSFGPTRNYLMKLTEELIREHGLSGPFLEIGCGDGVISLSLARRGWEGLALDLSEEAAQSVSDLLRREGLQDRVRAIRKDFFELDEGRKYRTIVLYDVLEHVKDDAQFMARVRDALEEGGHLLISVPVKMSEWRWDDDGYGHFRRYEFAELDRFVDAPERGFRKLAQWDITFPVLWLMRRVYLALKRPPEGLLELPIEQRTEHSAFENAGGKSRLIRLAEAMPVWKLAFWLQDRFRRRGLGCNTLVLARAVVDPTASPATSYLT